jgi:hypothetical protein
MHAALQLAPSRRRQRHVDDEAPPNLRHTTRENMGARTRNHNANHYGGLIMSAHDTFAEEFRGLLREIPAGTSLEEWKFLYRQVIFSMGMQILALFPEDAVGPDPSVQCDSGGGPQLEQLDKINPIITPAGQGPGTHPNCVTELAAFVLCTQPSSPKKPGKSNP